MHYEKVKSGDAFYIPTGRVHAIAAGVLLAEIQQTSDMTYRMYDYDRVDSKTGEKRDLNNELVIDVVDFKVYDSYKTSCKLKKNKSNKLVHSPCFKPNIFSIENQLQIIIYVCLEGALSIAIDDEITTIKKGETMLIPAEIEKAILNSQSAKKY